jgi:hypothetical protein
VGTGYRLEAVRMNKHYTEIFKFFSGKFYADTRRNNVYGYFHLISTRDLH